MEWDEGDLPDLMDFGFGREWYAAVVQGHVAQAEASARAAQMVCDHLIDGETQDARLFALQKRMRDAADRAAYHARVAAEKFEELEATEGYEECAKVAMEVTTRAWDAGLHLATVIWLLRPASGAEPGFGLPLTTPPESREDRENG